MQIPSIRTILHHRVAPRLIEKLKRRIAHHVLRYIHNHKQFSRHKYRHLLNWTISIFSAPQLFPCGMVYGVRNTIYARKRGKCFCAYIATTRSFVCLLFTWRFSWKYRLGVSRWCLLLSIVCCCMCMRFQQMRFNDWVEKFWVAYNQHTRAQHKYARIYIHPNDGLTAGA